MKKNKVKDSDILRAARDKVIEGERFVCLAIDACHIGTAEQINSLERWVDSMLKGHNYESWLSNEHFKVYIWMTKDDCRAGRIQWLDWMIAECEKDGN